MEDVLVKATAGDARIYAVTTTHLTQHMNEIHHCTPCLLYTSDAADE